MDPVRFSPFPSSDAATPLFLQRAGRTLLIGYREDDHWVLARGWRTGDSFTDIRRWRFQSPVQFIAQVTRLVREMGAGGSDDTAARSAAEQWVSEALPR
jgi:hypothetical protein